MQFLDFLNSRGLSLRKVAQEWGVSTSTLSRPAKGERWPTDFVMVRAFVMSDGQVSLADWIETCRGILETSGVLPLPSGENDGKTAKAEDD